jgi:hypothetical protein
MFPAEIVRLPPAVRSALSILGLCLPDNAPSDPGFRLTLMRPAGAEIGNWRVYAAHREWEFTYACDLPDPVVRAMENLELLAAAEAGGRVTLILSASGAAVARAVRTSAADEDVDGLFRAERGGAQH